MDNCACQWERTWKSYPFHENIRPHWIWEQTYWCRAHMEAEIAKQGQAAGADRAQDSGSATPSPFANVDSGRGIQQ